MTNPKIIGMMLIVAASIGLITIGFQSTMATDRKILIADLEEDVEAGNATTMMINQTATNGNMTGTDATGNTSANELGRISGTDGTVNVIGPSTKTPITTLP
jgi:CBS domain containing-hemolysin-like protein